MFQMPMSSPMMTTMLGFLPLLTGSGRAALVLPPDLAAKTAQDAADRHPGDPRGPPALTASHNSLLSR